MSESGGEAAWPVVDGFGFEDLRLAMDRAEVRSRLGEHRSFEEVRGHAMDQFPSGAMVSYDGEGTVVLIEVASPANPTIRGVELLGRDRGEVVTDLAAAGVSASVDGDGDVLVEDYGAVLYAPEGEVEGLMFDAT